MWDESTNVVETEWRNYWIPYVQATVLGFDPTNVNTQFGFCRAAGASGASCSANLISSRSSICSNNLATGPSCNQVSQLIKSTATTVDFALSIQQSINQYWSVDSGPTPRRLIVMVGGVHTASASSPSWASLWSQYTSKGIEVWAIGIGAVGSSDLTLLNNIVGNNAARIVLWTSSAFLPSDAQYMYLRVCPASTPLCPCSGFCACGGAANCMCPTTCNSLDACNPSNCTVPSSGCTVNPANALNCAGTDPCKVYGTCSDSNGVNVLGGTASCTVPIASAPQRVCSTS